MGRKTKRALDVRGVPPQHLAINCRQGTHGLCPGQRFTGYGKDGRPQYARCKCRCHH